MATSGGVRSNNQHSAGWKGLTPLPNKTLDCWTCPSENLPTMHRLLAAVLLLAAVILAPAHLASQGGAAGYPFRNPNLPDEERITDLISRMTLAEKIDCMGARAAVPRLGVAGSPHIEGYHGVAQGGPSNWGQRNPTPTTQFPQAYGLGATWDPELIRQVAAQEALEARYLFQSAAYNAFRHHRPRAERRPGARPALGPHRGSVRRGSRFTWARWPRRSRAACRATIPATGRRRRCSSTSSRTATRTAATAPRRTSTSASGGSTTRGRSSGPCATAARAR